jgi:hypothetical protein
MELAELYATTIAEQEAMVTNYSSHTVSPCASDAPRPIVRRKAGEWLRVIATVSVLGWNVASNVATR